MSDVYVTDLEGDRLRVNNSTTPDIPGAVVTVAAYILDRAGAVDLIEMLTAAVEAADAREATEAQKLKRGDKVHYYRDPAETRTVVSDEDEYGRVDVVFTGGSPSSWQGALLSGHSASYYVRA